MATVEMKTLTIGGVTFEVVDETARSAGIQSIERTNGDGSPGSTDTYTITFKDGSNQTFTVYNGKDGSDGKNGEDGATFTPSVDSSGNLSWTNDGGLENPETVNIKGSPGADGVGITSIEQTTTSTADGGENVFTVTLTNDVTATFTVKNGSKGSQGEPGVDGAKGDKGDTGEKGEKGDKGDTGATGAAGANGADGEDGQDGYSVYVSSVVSESDRIIITLYDEKNASERKITLYHGADGQDGADGVGISSIGQTTLSSADGGDNVFTVTLTNGGRATFTVKNGSKGSTGAAGADGSPGADGANGLSIYAYNGDMSIGTVAEGPTGGGAYQIAYVVSLGERTLQVGDLLVDLVGNVCRVAEVYSDSFDAAYVTSIRGAAGSTGETGPAGPEGPQGPAGSDASVTATNIETALGYTPASESKAETWTFTLADGSTVTKKVVLA